MSGEASTSIEKAGRYQDDPRAVDARADRTSFVWFAVFAITGQIITVWSYATELGRGATGSPVSRFALWEFSSILVILVLFPLVARAVSMAMPGHYDWKRLLTVHVPGVIAYSVVHILAFVMLRKIGHALFWGEHYVFTNNPLREFVYEFRKDMFTYVIIVAVIMLGRQFAQMKADLAIARQDAAATKQLSVKSGGRTLYVTVADILAANSSGNYLELKTDGRTLTLRMTLAALEDQVLAAGGTVVRVHRSWLINPSALRELKPTGSGDAVALLENGEEVPVSRRYRDRLEPPVSP